MPEKAFECEQCTEIFRYKWSMKKHMHQVHDGKGVEYQKCIIKGKDVGNMKSHVGFHEEVVHECQNWGKGSKRQMS